MYSINACDGRTITLFSNFVGRTNPPLCALLIPNKAPPLIIPLLYLGLILATASKYSSADLICVSVSALTSITLGCHKPACALLYKIPFSICSPSVFPNGEPIVKWLRSFQLPADIPSLREPSSSSKEYKPLILSKKSSEYLASSPLG